MANTKNRKIIVTELKSYQSNKIDVVKTIITSINKEFKVENITIGDISFDFNIELPQNDNFEFPNDMATYQPAKEANALEILNEIIWLYLFHKQDFCTKLEQFDHFILIAQTHKEYVCLYPAYHKIHIELLDNIISKSDCEGNNFEEYQKLFYSQYGIDLKEYLDRKPIHEEAIFDEPTEEKPTEEMKDPQTIYKEYQIHVNKYKMLRNIIHLNNTHNNNKITFNINASKPIHKLIKSYSSYIEINPLMTRQEVQKLVKQYYQICSESTELLKAFDKEAASTGYTKPTYALKSTAPSSKSGIVIIKSSIIIVMIMEHFQIDHIETAVRYFNYYWVKENYQSIQLDGKSLLNILNNHKCNHLIGTISLKKEKDLNLIKSGPTKRSIIKLVKLLKQSL